MTLSRNPIQEGDQQPQDADQVQATMQPIHEHLRVEVRRSQAWVEGAANRGQVGVPNI